MFVENAAFPHWEGWMKDNGMSEVILSDLPMQPDLKAVWRECLVHGYKQATGYDIFCFDNPKEFEDMWTSYLAAIQDYKEEPDESE